MTDQAGWNEQLAAITLDHEPMFPTALMGREERMIQEIAAAGTANGLNVGDRAPDFTLVNGAGGVFKLSGALRRGPVVLNFYRGQWCVYCNFELRHLLRIQPHVRELSGEIVMLSTEPLERAEEFAAEDPTHTPILRDADGTVVKAYKLNYTVPDDLRSWWLQYDQDLPEFNPTTGWDLPVPGTFVVDRGGVIRARHADMDWRKRMDPADVLAAVREIARA